MDSYRLEWRKSVKKDLRRLPPWEVARIVAAVAELARDPFPTNVKKLAGSERSYRLRVGDYRVIYEVFNLRLIIEVVKVGHRKDVYKS